ncbi:prepilin-type N-terminal cleavage/methylation domain-containing protein [Caldicellulosiruptor changbaiensis]|uniref:Prepilin-type N-terminal cleavage/methylation domain-containing protein n=1 Tax=Caldicellulosiruptor changbaiensis TaxID=1222016 RepID=A0A3T0D746_9FIRM|nr:prepilin-type N-terminal cleavage/methylation domain-containing protein [Caldicellulosiruptor changbaiensis]AZT90858.1 prepilin-type N-terminal cleavage/methylation domain-containing protein [Caldicellulosiruptor changbaiensis]
MRRGQRGFTLIEMVIVVAIVGIVVAALYSFFINNFKVAQEEAKIASIESQAKRLEDSIKQWLQMADQSSIVYYPSFKRVDMIVYEDASSSGVLVKIDYEHMSKSIRIEKGSSGAVLYLEGKVLRFNVLDNFPQLIIEYEVDLGVRGQTRTYKIVYNRRYD